MIPIQSHITSQKISYIEHDTSKNWIKDFPTENWCLIIISNEKKPRYFDEIIRKSIDRNVGYIVVIGEQHDLIHDMADEEIVFRDIDIENHYLPKHAIMTVGEEDLEVGLWFGLNYTLNEEVKINEIIILDLIKSTYTQIIELIDKFKKQPLL